MNDGYLFSVIIPWFRTERFLDDCIDSLKKQTVGFDKIQVLLIDDGNPDKALAEVTRKFCNYKNVRLLSKGHTGPSASRNLGLDFAVGEFSVFLDSDDMLSPNLLSEALLAAREDADCDVFCFPKKMMGGDKYVHFTDRIFSDIPKGSKKIFDFSKDRTDFSVSDVGSCIIRSSVIRNKHIRFNERLSYSEDGNFTTLCILNKCKLHCVHTAYYEYRVRRGSLTFANTYSNYTERYIVPAAEIFWNLPNEAYSIYSRNKVRDRYLGRYVSDKLFNHLRKDIKPTIDDVCRLFSQNNLEMWSGYFSMNPPRIFFGMIEFYLKNIKEIARTPFTECMKKLSPLISKIPHHIIEEFGILKLFWAAGSEKRVRISGDELSSLNNSFVISIDEGRRRELNSIFSKVGLNTPTLCPGVVSENKDDRAVTNRALCESHRKVVELAVKNNLDWYIVFEDDAYPCDDIVSRLKNLDLPDADVYLLGYTWTKHKVTDVTNGWFEVKEGDICTGAQAILVRKTAYQFLLDAWRHTDLPADHVWGISKFPNYSHLKVLVHKDPLFIQYNKRTSGVNKHTGYIFYGDHKEPPKGFSVISHCSKRFGDVTVAMATFPPRLKYAMTAIRSLWPQCDHLRVCFNGFSMPPQELLSFMREIAPQITGKHTFDYVLAGTGENLPPDLGCNNKMLWLDECNGYYLTVDDDIGYPSDYVSELVSAIDRYDGKCICSFHGSRYATVDGKVVVDPQHRTRYAFWDGQDKDLQVHVTGMGVGGCVPKNIRMSWNWYSQYPKNQGDDEITALYCWKFGIPQVCLKRPSKWISNIKVGDSYSLFADEDSVKKRYAFMRKCVPFLPLNNVACTSLKDVVMPFAPPAQTIEKHIEVPKGESLKDAVFILGSGSRCNDEELTLSMKSLYKYCDSFVRNVYVVGSRPRCNLHAYRYTYLPCVDPYKDSDKNIAYKIRYAIDHIPDLTEDFLLCSDDQFVTRPCTWKDFAPKTVAKFSNGELINNPITVDGFRKMNAWGQRLVNTLFRMAEIRHNVYFYEPHIWSQINKTEFENMLRDMGGPESAGIIFTQYFNYSIKHDRERLHDHVFFCRTIKNANTMFARGVPTFVSYNDNAFLNPDVRRMFSWILDR